MNSGSQKFFKTTRTLLLVATVLLAARDCFGQPIVWNGAGDGTSWSDAQNWVGQKVPGPANNVFITNLAGGAVIITSGVTVESILCSNALTISSGSLSVTTGASLLQGPLTVSSGGTVTATGSGTTLTSGGMVDIDNANLSALGGAVLALPGALEYNHSADSGGAFHATGSGSILALPGLTNITGMNVGSYNPVTLEVFSGGIISMGGLLSISNVSVQVVGNGSGSEVDLLSLRTFYGYINEGDGVSELAVGQGATAVLGQLGIVNTVDIFADGTGTMDLNTVTNMAGCTLFVTNEALSLPNVANIDNASFYVYSGSTLTMPGAVEYNHSDAAIPAFWVSGSGAVLNLTGLTNLTGMDVGSYYPLTIQALAGGMINLDKLVLSSNAIVQAESVGSGSTLDLSALRGFYGFTDEGDGFSQLQADSGGTLLAGQLGTINTAAVIFDPSGTMNLNTVTNMAGSTLTVTNGTVSLPNVVNIDNASLYVSGGATLSLPGVPSCNHTADSVVVFQASGIGSVLALTGLINLTGMNEGSYNPLMIQAQSGGLINLDGLISVSNAIVQAESVGSGSELNLSALRLFSGFTDEGDGFSQLQAESGGTVLVGQLGTINTADVSAGGTGAMNLGSVTNLAGSTLTVTNGAVTLPNVVDIDNASLYVSGGATLSLPGVLECNHAADSFVVFQASGIGSVLALTGLTNLTGMNEGSYNLLMFQALAGGLINLDGLISISNTIVQAESIGSGSELNLESLRMFSGYVNEGYGYSQLQAGNGGTVLAGQLGTVNEVDISEDGTGTLNLTAITNLAGATLIVTNGAVTLPNVVDIDNASLYVSNGATLSLPGIVEFNHSADVFAVFLASGSGSVLALTGLTNVTGTNEGSYNPLMIQALAGGLVNLDGLISSSNTIVQIESGGSGSELNLSALRFFYGYTDEGEGYSQFQATNGGTVLVGQLGTLSVADVTEDGSGNLNLNTLTNLIGATLTVTNEVVTLTNLVDIDNSSLYVSSTATLSLPGVIEYNHTAENSTVFQASGLGSVLALSGLANVTGMNSGSYSPLAIRALAGGLISLSNLISSSNTIVQAESIGIGSELDLSALRVFHGYTDEGEGFSQLQATSGGTVLVGQLGTINAVDISDDGTGKLDLGATTNLSGSTVILSGGTATLTNLVNIDGANLYVSAGAMLSLPNVLSYIDVSGGAVWEATSSGSVIALPGLANLTGTAIASGSTLVEGVGGGQVLLPNLQSISSGDVSFLSDGAGSAIDLTSLSTFVLQRGQGSLTAQNSGAILFNSQPFLLCNVAVNIPPGNPILPPTLAASPALTLCATPWDSYRVEERNTLNPGSQVVTLLVPLTNGVQSIAAAPPPNTDFLITHFIANPPILQIGLTPANEAQLVLFGLANATYQIQSTTNQVSPLTWIPGRTAVMTNSFRIFPQTPLAGTMRLYRAEQQ